MLDKIKNKGTRRNVLFILVDCLRADKCWGNNRTAKTPTIDLLCQKGTAFTQAIATTTTTSPSVSSILTGLYPFAHGIRSLSGYKIRSRYRTLAEIFKENGYNTYADITGPLIPEIGLNRGFDEYKVRDSKDNMYSPWYDTLLNKFRNKEFKEPWFIFIHFFDLHVPRALSPKYNNRTFGKNIYERALSSLDARLGDLLKYVDDDTIIVFHADHGEKFPETMFGELIFNLGLKQYYWRLLKKLKLVKKQDKDRLYFIGHGFHVYDYLVRVPLIFVGKKIFPENRWIPNQVRQIDIFPTIIDTLNLKYTSDYKIHGRSLLPLIRNEKMQENPAYCEACGAVLPDKSM